MNAAIEPLLALARAGMARGGASAGQVSLAALCGALAGLAAMAAVGCSLVALWTVVLPHLGAAGAALLLAGALAVLCLGLLALAFALARRGRRGPNLEANAEASLRAAAQLFKEHKGAMLLAALVAGLSAGAGGKSG
jgi:hypothetical protein